MSEMSHITGTWALSFFFVLHTTYYILTTASMQGLAITWGLGSDSTRIIPRV